jgi:hypothetical protein
MVARLTRHIFRKRNRIALRKPGHKEPTHALACKTRGARSAFQAEKFFKGLNLKNLLRQAVQLARIFALESWANGGVRRDDPR